VTAEAGEKLMRAFVALELDDAMRARLAELIGKLRDGLEGVRWVRPAGIHMTLRFLGYARRDALEALIDPLRRAAQETSAGEAEVSGLGTFPQRGLARVLWIGISLSPSVLHLQQACERAAVAAGLEAEARPFAPHVLYRSQPGPKGSIYTPLETFALGRPEPVAEQA
jgi:2'-5' RNA ligase